jgi:hypothetical protein
VTDDEAAGDAGLEGGGIVRSAILGTAVYVVAAAVGTAVLDLVVVTVVVSLVLFGLGTLAFLLAYFRAIGRSRYESIGMGGLFFLAGSAPGVVQRLLLGCLAVQVLVAFLSASVRIYTPVAFGLLVPMYGLGLSGLWGATYGTFPERGDGRSSASQRD